MTESSCPSSSLLALILVSKSSRGSQIIYRYPKHPRAVKRTLKPIYSSSKRRSTANDGRRSNTTASHSRDSVVEQGLISDSESDSSSASSSSSSSTSTCSSTHYSPTTTTTTTTNTNTRHEEHYLGLPNSIWSSILNPSRELCDQAFEFVFDHLAIVGHPVWLGDDDPVLNTTTTINTTVTANRHGGQVTSRRTRHTDWNDASDEHDDDGYEQEHDDDDDDDRGRTRRRPIPTPPAPAPAQRPTPKLAIAETPILTRTESNTSTLHPSSSLSSSASSISIPTSHASSSHSHSDSSANRLLSFNFCCIIDTPPDSHLSSHLEGFYKDVIVPMTANFKALEKKGKWLAKEGDRLIKLREKAIELGIKEIDEYLQTHSTLANSIAHLYDSLKADQTANLLLGASLPVQILMRGEVPIEEEYDLFFDERNEQIIKDLGLYGRNGRAKEPSDLLDDQDRTGGSRRMSSIERRRRSSSPLGIHPESFLKQQQRSIRPPLFSRMRTRPIVRFNPWQTLLLFQDSQILKRDNQVEPDGLLSKFLDVCSPTLSFAEFATLLDLESDDERLRQVVQHLCYWRKAKVIDVVSLKGVYYPTSSKLPRIDLITLSKEFSTLFSSSDLPNLPTFLSNLSSTEPYSTIIPSNSKRFRPIYYNALLFLLRNELVEKQKTFVRLVATESIKKRVQIERSASNNRDHHHPHHQQSNSSPIGSGLGGSGLKRSESSTGSELSTSAGAKNKDYHGMSISIRSNGSSHMTSPQQQQLNPPVSTSMGTNKRSIKSNRNKSLSTTTYSSSGLDQEEEFGIDHLGPSVIVEPGRPTMLESRWIADMTKEVDDGLRERFEQMRPFLNGTHDLDEIRHRSNLNRRDVRLVLSTFESYLIQFTHI